MEQSKKKQLIVSIIGIVLLIVATVGVTYSFFNYTRTGTANTVSVGRIAFNSSQDGRINLTNIFPIDPTETGVMNDATKVGTVAITVTGDTTYDKGVEYLVSAVNVSNTVGTGANQKTIPISISAETSGTLGTRSDNYFTARNTSTSHIYKVLAQDTISNNDQLMVGYIAKGATGINGTITIKAYINKNNIAITDTYDGTESDNMGTTTNWVDGRTVFTTTEWNSLQGTGISFQVKVEANEGIWVDDVNGENNMINISSTFTSAQKSSITEINFIKMSENEINTHANLIDLTDSNGSGVVKGWIDNNKLYIASPGITYFPQDSMSLLGNFSNVTSINFGNVSTSLVTNMQLMFNGCTNLVSLDLSGFDTSNVTNMISMFQLCSKLVTLNLNSFDTSNVTLMPAMFGGCISLTSLDLSSFDTSNVTVMQGFFGDCDSLTELNLSSFDTSNVVDMKEMFRGSSSLTTIYVSNTWNVSNVSNSAGMFGGCTSLKGGGTPQTVFDSTHTDKEYARIDGGANSATPGYLTLKTN